MVPWNELSSLYPLVDTLITLFEFIEDNRIRLKDLIGQSYDNASNMSGKYESMQAMIKT